MNKSLLFFLVVWVVFLQGCKRQVIPAEDIDLGKEYYNLTVGYDIEYAVDSIIYDDFNQRIDTFSLEFKDAVVDTFTDNEGRLSYRIQRYYRQDSTYAWSEHYNFYATPTSSRLEVVDRNLRFIKLVFPVKLNTRWYGNSYIPTAFNNELKWMDQWDYKYEDINVPFNTGFISFPSTVDILQADYTEGDESDPNSYSARGYSREVYAKNVGLIYKEMTRWEYQPSLSPRFKKGFTLIMRAKKYS